MKETPGTATPVSSGITNRVRVNVTTHDIQVGKRNNAQACPIARAAKRALKARDVSVRYDTVVTLDLLDPVAFPAQWTMPQEASNFVDEFDSGEPVLPFKFELQRKQTNNPKAQSEQAAANSTATAHKAGSDG